jgi:hypothetical protein
MGMSETTWHLVAYYVLALPVGITLAFHSCTRLRLEGPWIGASWKPLVWICLINVLDSGQATALPLVGLGGSGTDLEQEAESGTRRKPNDGQLMNNFLHCWTCQS